MRNVCCLLWLMCCLPICAQPKLRVVTELSPPHQIWQDGKVAGLSTELVRAILTEAGLTADIEMFPWARSLHLARSQPNILIYNLARTPERENDFQWIGTVAAYQLGFVALSHRHDIHIRQLNDARPYSIAVQRDDLSADFLRQQGFTPGQQLVLAADVGESWHLLLNGKVDLVIDDPVALVDMAAVVGLPDSAVRFVYAIPQLAQQTWLAASIETPQALVLRLQQAHAKVATTEQYHSIMTSQYRQQVKAVTD